MSEPDSAFVKLRIERARLVAWLDAPTPRATRWRDWREIGGQWYLEGGVPNLNDVSDAGLAKRLEECDGTLSGLPTNRAALRALLDTGEAPALRRISYDPQTRDFVAGNLIYDENLIGFLAFLTVARGAAAFLGPEDHGVAVIHNYVFGGETERVTLAALRLGPGGTSSFLSQAERGSAAGAFQSIADEMMSDVEPKAIDQLDALKDG